MAPQGRVLILCALLAVQTSVHCGLESSNAQCDPPGQWKAGQALDEDASTHSGATIRLLSPVKAGKMQECVSRCCQLDKCRVAAIEVQDRGKILCALYDCSPPEKCVFKKSEKLLSYDRTETWFLTRGVTKPPTFPSTEAHTETRATTSATTVTSQTSSTVDTTMPYVTDTTRSPASNATTVPASYMSVNLTTIATTRNTMDAKLNTAVTTSITATTVDVVSNHTVPPTTESYPTTKHNASLNEILHERNESSTIGVTPVDLPTSTVTSTSVAVDNTEPHFNTVSTTAKSSSVSPRTSTLQLSLTTERTRSGTRTRASSTTSPALQASMQGIFPPRDFDYDSWLPLMSSTARPTTKLAEETAKTTSPPRNVIDAPDQSRKVADLRRPIQIFAPTTLNVVAKASPSISLVIGLSLGLLLIFVVMGLIGRRVVDVWQRRHYSRMDFLVDGMYHVT
ncbi:unnamed protein product [Ixodes hexagonus]